MAAVFTLNSRRVLSHKGHGQNGKSQELHIVTAGALNDVDTYELATTLHKIENVSIEVIGTSTKPYVNEYANTTEGVINAAGTSVTLTWAAAPNTSIFHISLLGH